MSTALTFFLSILATIFFGFIFGYIFYQRQIKRNTIIHFRTDEYDIGKGLSDEFPNFKLTYSGNELTTNVRALKGGFMNKGRNDIDKDSTFDIIYPANCIVKDFKPKLSDDSMKVIAIIDETNSNIVHLTIQEGIFRTNMFFEYMAIVETSEQEKLGKIIKLKNNVLNTDMKNNFVGSVLYYTDTTVFSRRMGNISLITLLLACTWIGFNQPVQVELCNNSTNETVKIVVAPNNQLYEGNILSGKKLSNEDLSINYHFVPKVSNSTFFKKKYWIILIIVIVAFLVTNIDFSGGKRYVIKVLEAAEKAKKSEDGQEQKSNFLSKLFG